MAELKARDAAAFVKARDPRYPLVLLFGPDQGLVRERADLIARQVVPDLTDPWAVADMNEDDLPEPGRLADEAQALSFGGGDRIVRVRGGGPSVTAAVVNLLKGIEADTVKPTGVTIVEAGDLKKTSGLRKAVAKSPAAAGLPCYAEEARDVVASVREALAAEDLTITDEALMAFAARLGDDRGVTRSETEKLAMYAGPRGTRDAPYQVTLADVDACLAGGSQDATFEIWDRAASGDARGLSDALRRAEGAGVSLLGVVRIAQGKLVRLLTALRASEAGQPPRAAMKALRPPVFYGEEGAFLEQMKRWDARRLEAAAESLFEAELAAKRTGAPQRELIERALLRVAAQARRG